MMLVVEATKAVWHVAAGGYFMKGPFLSIDRIGQKRLRKAIAQVVRAGMPE